MDYDLPPGTSIEATDETGQKIYSVLKDVFPYVTGYCATVPTTVWRGKWIVPNGERIPGYRSPEV
ncbi:MAG: hypothetical protein EBZ89_13955, partial [Chloroflexi bacterium]|nr:hypothetical protein [Chloroflexota bacterium]